MAFPSYDKETDCIRLNGARVIMLTLLMKARFGEPFDPEVILILGLLSSSDNSKLVRPERPTPGHCFSSHQDMWTIAKSVYDNSFQNGWWGWLKVNGPAFFKTPWHLGFCLTIKSSG
jgi:hypothetical protein